MTGRLGAASSQPGTRAPAPAPRRRPHRQQMRGSIALRNARPRLLKDALSLKCVKLSLTFSFLCPLPPPAFSFSFLTEFCHRHGGPSLLKFPQSRFLSSFLFLLFQNSLLFRRLKRC